MDRPLLTAKPRSILGKKVKRLRLAGKIPAVLYGHNVSPMNVELTLGDFSKLYRSAGSNTIVKLALDSEDRNVLIHEPDLDPVTGAMLHVDLYQVSMTEKITAEVPLHFNGDAPAVREQDGILVTNKDSVEVECLPADLPHSFEIDLTVLDAFDKSIKVSDIKVPAAVTLLTDPEETIVFVEEPRSEEELAELEEAPVEGELPAVEGETATPVEGEEAPAAEESETPEAS